MNQFSKLSFMIITICIALFLSLIPNQAQGITAYGYNANGGGGIPVGPFYFDLSNTEALTSIQDQNGQTLVTSGSWANGIWYASAGTNFITINPTTGNRTIIGSMGRSINGMSFDITTNTMFAVAYEAGMGNLYEINLTNGSTSFIGSSGPEMLFVNLACDNNGDLYGIDLYTNGFYRIDKENATVTLIGLTGFTFNYAQDMEFDLINNICYAGAIYNDGGWIGNLLTIDIETGAASVAGLFPNSNLELTGFAIPFTPECLAFPSLMEPLNKAIEVLTSPTFLWNEVEDADSYTIQISTDANFENIIFEDDGITGTFFELPIGSELEEVTQYWWHIMANAEGDCNSYWSNKWSFTTEGNLIPPVLIFPENISTDVFAYPTLTWEAVPGAQFYQVQVATDEFFNDLIYDEYDVVNSVFFARALELETTHYWRVMAYNSAVYSDWSEEWSFTTSSISPVFGYNTSGGIIPEGPVVFELANVSNMNSLDEQSALTPIWCGTWANDEWYGATYDGNTETGSFFTIDKVTGNRNTISTLAIYATGLSYDATSETMFAVVITDDGCSLYSIDLVSGAPALIGNCGEHLFINLACDLDGDLYAVDISDDNFYYIDKFTGIVTPIGPMGYSPNYAQDMEFDKTNNICYWTAYVLATNNDYIGAMFTIDKLSGEATLVSLLPGGMEMTGFAIPFENPCLAFPQLEIPENNSYCQGINPNFDWNDVVGANNYILQIATDKYFNDIVYESEEINSSSYSLPGADALENITRYYWRVMAFEDEVCTSFWSARSTFMTEGDLPAPQLASPVDNSNGISLIATFNWEGNLAATSYHLQVSSTSDFSGIIIDDESLTETSYTYSSLAPLTQYYWRVSMTNPCDVSDWSEVWTFTTGYSSVVGTGTQINDDITYPAPYGNYFFGAKHQILVLADELAAAGATPGFLTSLAFEIGQIYSDEPLIDFTIKMKQTTATQLITGWDEIELQQVYYSPSYFNTLGWNIHQFDTPFIWDGVSNILVDVCFNNSSWSSNQGTYFTPTNFSSVLYFADDIDNVCSVSGTATSSVNRPNMMFIGMEGEPQPPAPILSLPLNGSSDVDTNPLLVWTEVEEAANYRVQLSDNAEFDNLIVNTITSDVEYLVTENLDYSTQYWWRVRSITQLGTLGPWTDAWSFTTELESININLAAGWNMISSYLNPANNDIEQLFAPIVSDLRIVKNGVGQMYDPAFGINTIENWFYSDGYLVNMINTNTLTFTGTKIIPETTPLFLFNGWNLSAYFRDNPMSPVNALASINSVLVLAKNNEGGIYSPAYGINTIGNMQPNEGYYFYLNNPGILTYPANGALKAIADEVTPNTKFLVPAYKNTGNNATLILSVEYDDGNEIGVFNSNDVLIGSGVINNGIAAITIWGDDEISPNIDGANDYENLIVKLLNTGTNSFIDINLTDINELTNNGIINSLIYQANSIYLAKAVVQAPTNNGFSLAIIPNPVSNTTSFEFTLPNETNAEIQIYNVTGELVSKIVNANYKIGFNKVQFDIGNLANGVYNVVLISTEGRCSSTMIVNK